MDDFITQTEILSLLGKSSINPYRTLHNMLDNGKLDGFPKPLKQRYRRQVVYSKASVIAFLNGSDKSVFIISEERAKNAHERIVPLNSVALSIVNQRRKNGSDYVFDFEGRKLDRLTNKAWRKARESVGLKSVRIHDLRHTFGMRLRAAGVSFEDRQDLLGHHAGRITTHYSKVEINRLIDCVELLCENRKPELTLIRRAV